MSKSNLNPKVLGQESGARLRLKKSFAEIQGLLSQSGYQVETHSSAALARLEALPFEALEEIQTRVSLYSETLLGLEKEKIALKNTQKSIWRVIKSANLIPNNDLFENVENRDVVEIFMADNTQLYRSASYFDCSSYSIADLFVFSWPELFWHNDNNTDDFHEITKDILANKYKKAIAPGHGESYAYEKFSEKQFIAQTNVRSIVPLQSRDTKKNAAYAVVWNINIVGSYQDKNLVRKYNLD